MQVIYITNYSRDVDLCMSLQRASLLARRKLLDYVSLGEEPKNDWQY